MVAQEFRNLLHWEKRHKLLVGRLLLVLILTLIVDVFGTAFEYFFERGVKGGDIHSIWDAAFFSTVQLLTVSSQIRNPLTVGGRLIDIALEIWAVIVVGGSAGAITSFFQAAPDSS
jgi:hypothetical protein